MDALVPFIFARSGLPSCIRAQRKRNMGDNGTNDYVVFGTTRAGRSDDEIKARRAFPVVALRGAVGREGARRGLAS